MPRMRFSTVGPGTSPRPLPFPVQPSTSQRGRNQPPCPVGGLSNDRLGTNVFAAFEVVSRRMEDLARDLGCLGFFDDDDDRPCAA